MSSFTKYERLGAYHWRGMDRSWSGLASAFSLFDHSRYGLIRRALGGRPQRVLEVGCGDGALSHLLAVDGHEVWGVDLEAAGIALAQQETAQRRYRVAPRFLRGDLFSQGFEGRAFEGIVLADVIEHVEDAGSFLRRLLGLLAPGGVVVLTTPARREGRKWDACHTREFDRRELEGLLSGFPGRAAVVEWLPDPMFRLYERPWGRLALNVASLAANPFLLPAGGQAVMLFATLQPGGTPP